jgi:hypothetical protein
MSVVQGEFAIHVVPDLLDEVGEQPSLREACKKVID